MKLAVNKIAQGPVLAKGEDGEPFCGSGTINGNDRALGCGQTTNGVTTFGGVSNRNGGEVGVQMSGSCSC